MPAVDALFYITFINYDNFVIYDAFGTIEAQGIRKFYKDNNKIVYTVESKGLTNLINHAIKRYEKLLKTDKKNRDKIH